VVQKVAAVNNFFLLLAPLTLATREVACPLSHWAVELLQLKDKRRDVSDRPRGQRQLVQEPRKQKQPKQEQRKQKDQRTQEAGAISARKAQAERPR